MWCRSSFFAPVLLPHNLRFQLNLKLIMTMQVCIIILLDITYLILCCHMMVPDISEWYFFSKKMMAYIPFGILIRSVSVLFLNPIEAISGKVIEDFLV